MNVGGSRLEKLGQISAYTLDKFIEAIHKGAMMLILRWALQVQQKNLLGFKASRMG